jgi:hypothetical protein
LFVWNRVPQIPMVWKILSPMAMIMAMIYHIFSQVVVGCPAHTYLFDPVVGTCLWDRGGSRNSEFDMFDPKYPTASTTSVGWCLQGVQYRNRVQHGNPHFTNFWDGIPRFLMQNNMNNTLWVWLAPRTCMISWMCCTYVKLHVDTLC